MGTYSDFRIGKFSLETSGNFNTTTHRSVFLPSDSAVIERDYGEKTTKVEVFRAPLRSLVTRLELLGSTLPAIERRFANPYVTYDEPHDVSFAEALNLIRTADLNAIAEFDVARDGEGIFSSEYEPRRVCRRPFRLSYAAMAGASRLA